MGHQKPGIDSTEIEALTARENSDRDLADLRRGKDELCMRRRLFKGLEQRIECLRGEHVHFVENIDLVARTDRSVADGIVDLAYVINTVVRGGIHFDDVDMPA